VLQPKIVTVIKIETPIQFVILTLPIYALLIISIITLTLRGLNPPHASWRKPQQKSKTKRRKQHIIRLKPGNITIEEEEKEPRGKPKGARGQMKTQTQKVDQILKAHQTTITTSKQKPQRSSNPTQLSKKQ
jgi:hypothetical protein